ncbi:hypothetical protein CEXT_76651 [Caerostris extrusa]|uniref:Uncharacterized protein n=1 Tax=Caerostris extrusa TaxID=172846 RepID=A0AAV4N1I2_CAEEX|nr:hypothetical protein CEXT_76651 [Caerostris extrusa]
MGTEKTRTFGRYFVAVTSDQKKSGRLDSFVRKKYTVNRKYARIFPRLWCLRKSKETTFIEQRHHFNLRCRGILVLFPEMSFTRVQLIYETAAKRACA